MKANPTGTDPPSGITLAELAHMQRVVTMNEALTLGSVRQHELTAAAESLNAQLQLEIAARVKTTRDLAEKARLLDLTEDAIIVRDVEDRISYWNRGAEVLYGWSREEAIGKTTHSLLQTESSTPTAQIARELSTNGRWTGELVHTRRDGQRITVLARKTLDRDRDGNPAAVLQTLTDVTERKKREQQSLRSQRMESIGTLAGGIAHDLNNSLGPIMMSIELLRMKFADADSQELIGLLEASAQRGADMVRQILSFARGVEGRRAEVQVPQLVREIEKIVNETFRRHIQIQTLVPSDVWMLTGDSSQLHQVLLNLCLNARDAMPNGGVLVVSAENRQIDAAHDGLNQNPKARPGPYVVLEIEDSGTGMPPKIVENIFDPFFTTKEFGKGSGLGLPTALAIIKSHGGFLHVASEVGKGTTFQVFLPAQIRVASPAPPPPTLERPEGKGELILVVDDEEPMRRMTQQILEAFGYRVVLACDGAEAVALYGLRATEIAAVITDMTMPVMEGPEAIRILRTMNPNLPIIGASGLASTNYKPELARLGVKHILSKPYTTPELLKMLKQVLETISPEEGQQGPNVLS